MFTHDPADFDRSQKPRMTARYRCWHTLFKFFTLVFVISVVAIIITFCSWDTEHFRWYAIVLASEIAVAVVSFVLFIGALHQSVMHAAIADNAAMNPSESVSMVGESDVEQQSGRYGATSERDLQWGKPCQ